MYPTPRRSRWSAVMPFRARFISSRRSGEESMSTSPFTTMVRVEPFSSVDSSSFIRGLRWFGQGFFHDERDTVRGALFGIELDPVHDPADEVRSEPARVRRQEVARLD